MTEPDGGGGSLPTKVAVIGAGDIGCGWAALCVAAGWPVAVPSCTIWA